MLSYFKRLIFRKHLLAIKALDDERARLELRILALEKENTHLRDALAKMQRAERAARFKNTAKS